VHCNVHVPSGVPCVGRVKSEIQYDHRCFRGHDPGSGRSVNILVNLSRHKTSLNVYHYYIQNTIRYSV